MARGGESGQGMTSKEKERVNVRNQKVAKALEAFDPNQVNLENEAQNSNELSASEKLELIRNISLLTNVQKREIVPIVQQYLPKHILNS